MHTAPPPGFRGRWLTAEPDLAPFGEASGILAARPRAAAVPRDAADLRTLVAWAATAGVPLVPRGAGTGMPGGNVGSGVAVDMVSHFHRVEVDAEHRTARVGPGVSRAALNEACRPHGLFFPVDPSSGARATLGGMIANNAAGAHSVLYGATREWVERLDLVLADGGGATLVRGERPPPPLIPVLRQVDAVLKPDRAAIEAAWPRVRKNSSGYALREYLHSGDALDLLVGSEGTLALIAGATVRLAPLPAATAVALLEFTSLEAAGEAVLSLLPHGPATCEMLDRTFLELVRAGGADAAYPLRAGLEALLLVEVQGGSAEELRHALRRVEVAVRGRADRVSTALEPERQERFWEVRHAASPLIAARADRRVSMQFIEDGVVPVERLPDYVRLLRTTLARHDLPAVIFGHAGDGNLHVNPLVDVHQPAWRDTVEAVLREIAEGVAALGGTLAGEHGDGRLRAPLLPTIWGDAMVRRFAAVKHAFDPDGILNPGVILPLPGQRPLDALRPYAR